ncbi:hypothetical protein BX616_001126 [Lobosporangium transversale]|uniref:Uncharacterized protein n=1 Tax=Lobosporangium transversale TaxID=64571 RepID=A0A1Y2GVT8_9FUNG|nr:hypothetical protein BCR41DRAFT_349734 [Lobosporangium transversale]KAF9905001.1 hypothetical protein BX616_001126 [Lobosporangium transversale]ORZ22824.1 hypothetical protein BCR41DRAFT_349734 [Lobosporangium transversale]|eukprot:XP_021883378.1 hypothetical protein BCR41DRAFT_349734 [Lobosporangium transversale]
MGAEYIVFGRAIPTYKLALATYAAIATPIAVSKFTKKDAAAVNVVPASSQDEDAFIHEFLKAAEEDHTHNV